LTRVVLAVMILSLAGCVSWSPVSRPSAALLVNADRLVTQGRYAEALDAYEEVLAKYPEAAEAARARVSREAIAELLAARAQIARLTAGMKTQEAELARLRELAAARAGELGHARAEIARLTADADRLRTDLEQLKRIDIDMERRRK
jgi:tetratricopeptide (TPR) repeat protein